MEFLDNFTSSALNGFVFVQICYGEKKFIVSVIFLVPGGLILVNNVMISL